MALEIQVTFDCADPHRLATFWAAALDSAIEDPPDGHDSWEAWATAVGLPQERRNDASAVVDRDGVRPRLYFQRVPEGKTVKNRVHLDVRAAPGLTGEARMAALEARATDLVILGATRLRRVEPDDLYSSGFIVMADPEGNEFCLD